MEIHHIIVHHIKKEQSKTGAALDLSDDVLRADASAKELVEELDKLFVGEKPSFSYGVFQKTDRFPKDYQNYIGSPTKESFIAFTKSAMESLKSELSGANFAKGGYLLFTDYTYLRNNNDKRYFGVFLIRNSRTFRFSPQTSGFELQTGEQLDIQDLAMCCQIDVSKYLVRETVEGNYLRLTKNAKLHDISEFFTRWLGIAHYTNNKQYTKSLVEIVKKIDLPFKEDGQQYERQEFSDVVHQSIRVLERSSPLNLLELGKRFFPENERAFIDYAETNNIEIVPEFKPTSLELKGLYRYDVDADGIVLRFDHHSLGNKIKLDDQDPELITIRSIKLADRLRTEQQEFNGNG